MRKSTIPIARANWSFDIARKHESKSMKPSITLEMCKALLPQMTDWRRKIHANPETAFKEYDTSDFVAAQLEDFGIKVHRGLAETGVVGVLENGEGPMVGLRADMDALHMQEKTTLAYRSKNEGCMHACGHDGHTAMLLGAAKILAQNKSFSGTIVFIFQPAEENEGGARVMVEQGLFNRFPVEQVYGLHNWPSLQEGHMAVGPGPMMAANETFEIIVTGQGAHAAMPHMGRDPVVAAAHLITALQTITSRRTDPQQAGVVTVTQIHGGDAWNVIPNEVVLKGTLRWFDPQLGEAMKRSIKQVCKGMASSLDCAAQISFVDSYPATINTPETASICADVMAELIGEERVERNPVPSMGAEDFSYMLQEKPGSYVWLGTGVDPDCPKLHNPYYDFNDRQLSLGAAYWVHLAQTLLPAQD